MGDMNRKNVIVGLATTAAALTLMKTMAQPTSAAPRFGLCSPAALLALLNTEASTRPVVARAVKGQIAPDWELAGLDGKPIKLSDYKGRVVLLNFWATWCPPCRKEIPTFTALQKEYDERGVVVIGVSLDQGGTAAVRSFAERMGINYPIMIGDEHIQATYGIQAIPTTFVIDRAGNIVGQHQGDTGRASLEADIKASL